MYTHTDTFNASKQTYNPQYLPPPDTQNMGEGRAGIAHSA